MLNIISNKTYYFFKLMELVGKSIDYCQNIYEIKFHTQNLSELTNQLLVAPGNGGNLLKGQRQDAHPDALPRPLPLLQRPHPPQQLPGNRAEQLGADAERRFHLARVDPF